MPRLPAFALTDALKAGYSLHACRQLFCVGSLDTTPWSTRDSLHLSTPYYTDSLLAVCEAAVH